MPSQRRRPRVPSALSPLRDAPAEQKLALVIGIRQYEQEPPLRSAARDARAFAELLHQDWGFPSAGITLMTDDARDLDGQPDPTLRPTRANIASRICSQMERLGPESELVVFYAGLGIREDGGDWLVPSDARVADRSRVERDCISVPHLIQDLGARPHRRIVLFLDLGREAGP